MATAPSPFFFPSSATICPPPGATASGFYPAPAYIPYHYPTPFTAPSPFPYPAPTSGCFPAPAYGSSSFPSAAATYHHPFPFTTPVPFPSTATYPYTPESTAPPSPEPPTTGDSTTSVFPYHDSSSTIPLVFFDHHTVPAATEAANATPTPNRERQLPQSQTYSSPCDGGVYPIKQSSSAVQLGKADEKFVCKRMGSSTISRANASPNHHLLMHEDAAVRTPVDERVLAKDDIRHRRQQELLNIQARLDQQQVRERTAFDTIQGELAKLTSMASQLAISIGKQISSTHVGNANVVQNPSYQACTTTISQPSVTPGSSYVGVSGTTSVAPQVFGGMTSSISCQGTQGMVSNYCSGHHNHIQSSCVSNLSEQNIDKMPQCYGLHNLNRQSLFRADGTEHKHFTLPANYPLERDIPKPVFVVYDDKPNGCSNEFGHVFTSTSEQQSYEEEQQGSEQLLKCVVNAPETEQTIAYLNTTSDVQDFPLELQQQEYQRACKCSVLKAYDSDVTMSTELSTEHCKRELRLLWDPGASTFLMTPLILNDGSSNNPIGNEHVGKLVSSAGDFNFLGTTNPWSQSEQRSVVIRGVFEEVMLNKPPAKPPDMSGIAASSPQGNRFSLEDTPSWQRGALSLGNFAITSLWRNTTLDGDKTFGAQHILDSSMKKRIIFSSGHILAWNPRYAILLLHYFLWEFSIGPATRLKWDPGVSEILHSYSATHPIGTRPGIFIHVLQPISASAIKCSNALCWGCTEVNAALVQLNCPGMNVGLTLIQFLQTSCEWIPTVIISAVSARPLIELHHSYGGLYMKIAYLDSDEQPTDMCHSTMLNSSILLRHMVPVLSCLLASFGSRSKLQWDPGIAISSYMYSWLEMTAVKISTWLQNPLPMNKTSSVWDPGIESLYFSCNRLSITELIQIKGWTSMTYNGIFLSEYPYILIFLHEQWEFLHQQGVQKNYNAKNLLAPQKYPQICEMDIIFITFLPP